MADDHGTKLPLGPPGALKRPDYQAGSFLAHADLRVEQRYLWQRLRRHNRFLHGWGVVCGMIVVAAKDVRRPWLVRICPGYAIGPYGDEIDLETAVPVDIADYLWLRPLDVVPLPSVVYVGIQYAERLNAPVAMRTPGCGCHEGTEFSRIGDCFRIDVSWEPPPSTALPVVDLCNPKVAPCSACPESPEIMLASIRLPANEADVITTDMISNF